MNKLILSVSVLAVCCIGCKVGPNYDRPHVEVPETWRFKDPDAQEVSNPQWWQQFNDPVLDGLIQTALQENKDVKVATARIEQFIGTYETTRSSLFPQISGGASAGRTRTTERGPIQLHKAKPNPVTSVQRLLGALSSLTGRGGTTPSSPTATTSAVATSATPTTVTINPANSFSAGINANWQIDLWGKIRRATEAARARILSAEEAKRTVILTLITTVANEYISLRDLDRQLEIARVTAQTREKSYNLFKLQFSHGLISALEINQAESELQQALAAIPALERAVAQQENALSVLLGRNPGPIDRGKSIDELTLPKVPEGLPSDLLENRPDVRQAEQDLIAANAEIGAARAQYFPSISLTGAYGFASTALSNLFSGPANTWSYAAPVTVPIFTGGAIAGQVKTAKAIQQEALENYLQVIQSSFREVEDALAAEKTTRAQLDATDRRVQALSRYAYFARRRFDNGYTSYLEVLDAERSLFAAQLVLAQTKGDLFQSLVNVYKAMGGGWVVSAESMASPNEEESSQ